MSRHRVTVICPTYNRSRAIEPTLTSALAQTHGDLGLVVVSDGSTDDTDDVVAEVARQDSRVSLLRLAHAGHPSPARQHALCRADTDLIAYLDHDDVWEPGHLATLLALLGDDADIAVSGYTATDEQGRLIRRSYSADLWWHPELQTLDPLFEPSRALHRRAAALAVGGWRQGPGLEDWDLWHRLSLAGARFRTTSERTCQVRHAPTSRRHHVPATHWALVLSAGHGPDLVRAMQLFHSPPGRGALADAALADRRSGRRRLAADPATVRPAGPRRRGPSRQGPGDIPELHLIAHGREYALALPLYCASAQHAAHLRVVLWRHTARQRRVLAQILAEHDLDRVVRLAADGAPPVSEELR